MIHSKRHYSIAILEGGEINIIRQSLEDLIIGINSIAPFEYSNSIAEILDNVLDLLPGNSLYFRPNRDDADSKGIIVRTK